MAKRREPQNPRESTLGTVLARPLRTSVAGLVRLESQHPAVRHILEVLELLQKRSYVTHALISGEPGTGKEGLAHTLHELMHPTGAPIVTVSTLGLSEADLAVELFGAVPHHRGETKIEGAVERADGGTIVLDEITALTPGIQRRLVELLRRGNFHREGEGREREARVSVIGMTDGNVAAEVAAGRFRNDLYYKLARLDFVLPPLRERPEDIPSAVAWMASRILSTHGLETAVELESKAGEATSNAEAVIVRRGAIEALAHYRWPGNFRELEIVVERALMLYGDGKEITANNITKALSDPRS